MQHRREQNREKGDRVFSFFSNRLEKPNESLNHFPVPLHHRPQFLNMLEMARPRDVIVVWRLDRLGRSLRQLIETVTQMSERGIEFKSLKENIDTTTPTGKLLFHIVGAMAEFERDIIRERTTAGLDAARARGRKGGRPKATETIKPRNLVRAKELYAANEKSIAEIMEQTGFKSRATFYKYVVNTEKA